MSNASEQKAQARTMLCAAQDHVQHDLRVVAAMSNASKQLSSNDSSCQPLYLAKHKRRGEKEAQVTGAYNIVCAPGPHTTLWCGHERSKRT